MTEKGPEGVKRRGLATDPKIENKRMREGGTQTGKKKKKHQ